MKKKQRNRICQQFKEQLTILTGKIIGCAMRVHSALGNGFQEVIYQRALEIEMNDANIEFSKEHEMPIYYKQKNQGNPAIK